MRYELSDYEWTAIKRMLPHKPRGAVRTQATERRDSPAIPSYLSPRGACRLGCHSGSPAFRNPSLSPRFGSDRFTSPPSMRSMLPCA